MLTPGELSCRRPNPTPSAVENASTASGPPSHVGSPVTGWGLSAHPLCSLIPPPQGTSSSPRAWAPAHTRTHTHPSPLPRWAVTHASIAGLASSRKPPVGSAGPELTGACPPLLLARVHGCARSLGGRAPCAGTHSRAGSALPAWVPRGIARGACGEDRTEVSVASCPAGRRDCYHCWG